MVSETAFIGIYVVTVLWLIAAAVYTYIVAIKDFRSLYLEYRRNKSEGKG